MVPDALLKLQITEQSPLAPVRHRIEGKAESVFCQAAERKSRSLLRANHPDS